MPKPTADQSPAEADTVGAEAASAAVDLRPALLLHQQELEDQNQELRRTQAQLAGAHDRYRDLFDHAPVGYVTLDGDGRVLEANQTARAMVGQQGFDLRGQRLSGCMAAADADRWHLHCVRAMQQPMSQAIELQLRRPGGEVMHAHLDCLGVARPDGTRHLRVTVTDLTLQWQVEESHRSARRAVAAQEAERLRISRQLHDDLGQRLSLAKMQLTRLLASLPAEAGGGTLLDALEAAVATVRRVAAELGPLMLADLGLSAAVDAYARDAAARAGWQLTLRLPADDLRLEEQDAVSMYRVFQQALGLMADTPGLRTVTVDLVHDAGVMQLRLQGRPGDGQGSAAGAALRPRWRALRDSARLLGCDVSLDRVAAAGVGCTIRLATSAPPARTDSR